QQPVILPLPEERGSRCSVNQPHALPSTLETRPPLFSQRRPSPTPGLERAGQKLANQKPSHQSLFIVPQPCCLHLDYKFSLLNSATVYMDTINYKELNIGLTRRCGNIAVQITRTCKSKHWQQLQ
ncbi:hypothetical protein LINPERPRIM_LOCUS28903, partial [Linum perenne]